MNDLLIRFGITAGILLAFVGIREFVIIFFGVNEVIKEIRKTNTLLLQLIEKLDKEKTT